MIQVLIHKSYAHIIQRPNTSRENTEDYIATYLPTFFFSLNKAIWIIKYHTSENQLHTFQSFPFLRRGIFPGYI